MSVDLARAGASGSAWTLGAQGAVVLFKAAGIVLLARLIDPSTFGIAAIATSLASLLTSLVLVGLGMAAVQARTLSRAASSALFLINLGVGIFAALLLILGAAPLASLYGHPELASVMPWLAVAPLFTSALSQPRVHLIRDLRFKFLALSDVISNGAAFAVAVVMAVGGHGLAALIVQFAVQPVILAGLVIAAARWRPAFPTGAGSEVRALLRVGLDIFGMNVAVNVARSMLVPIVGLGLTAAPLGQLDRALQIVNLPISLIVDQLQRVAVPVFARANEAKEQFASFVLRAHQAVTYGVSAVFLLGAVVATPLFDLLLGDEWNFAARLFSVLAIGAVFRAVVQISRWVYIAAGQTRFGLKFNVWAQSFVLVFSLVGLPWGAEGVVIANSVMWFVLWPISAVLMSRAVGLDSARLLLAEARAVLFMAVPAVIAAAVSGIEWETSLAHCVVALLTFVVVLVGEYILLRPFRRDVKAILGALRRATQ